MRLCDDNINVITIIVSIMNRTTSDSLEHDSDDSMLYADDNLNALSVVIMIS